MRYLSKIGSGVDTNSGYYYFTGEFIKTMNLLKTQGNVASVPSRSSSPDDFDFLLGQWKIHNRKLKSRLDGCTTWIEFEAAQDCRKILNGYGNIDSFLTDFDGKTFEGMTLRLFNPKTRLWNIYWADSDVVVLDVPQVGSFENNIGEFYARDVYAGREIIVKFSWD